MIVYQENTDATCVYRDTSAVSTIRMDSTGDTGGLLQVLRDAVIVIGSPLDQQSKEKIPSNPAGSLEAVSAV